MKREKKIWTAEFAAITLINALSYVANFMLMSTLPLIVSGLVDNKLYVGAITALYTVTGLLVRPGIGRALDRTPKRRVLLLGLAILLASMVSYQFAVASIGLLFAIRAFHGIGWSAITTSTNAIAVSVIPPSRRNEGVGYFSASLAIAMVIGPALGLFLFGEKNCRLLLGVAACLVLAAGILALLLGKGVGGTGVTAPRERSPFALEREALYPSAVFGLIVVTYGSIMTFLPLYARSKGVENIGAFFVVLALSILGARVWSGKLADHAGTRLLLPCGIALMAAASLLLYSSMALAQFLASALLYGTGYGIAQPILNTMVIASAAEDRKGSASASFLCAMDLGGIVSSVLWGWIAQAAGYRSLYSLSTVILCLTLALVTLRPRKKGANVD